MRFDHIFTVDLQTGAVTTSWQKYYAYGVLNSGQDQDIKI